MKMFLPFLKPLYSGLEPFAYPLIRVTAGLLLVPHGAQKLFGWFGGDPAKTIVAFQAIGFKPADFFVDLTGSIEFVGGLLIAVGLLTRPAAAVCAGLLTVTIYVTSARGWSAMEYSILWTTACLAITVLGGGRLSVDRLICREF
ncbi:DoxX family protein [Bradyrhizobium sp. CCBAU 53340]|uniref:DoxX family protein n=1 Tax=Bradyrhizobium sp. CCBAU 53340 TaxID=1325112 RepID=UPI00188B6688|nr:DoxX family protein [Bradyrhizobium sp. CCBAU 53340]QOZ44738.1 DoxX family protein [Bradyrhizobium sp. CCBAU 53340]